MNQLTHTGNKHAPQYTNSKIEASAPPTVTKPEYVRLPAAGQHEHYSGLGRAHLNQLIRENRIKSISLRKRGAARGVRLIVLDSLLDYIKSFDASPAIESPVSTERESAE